jgi:hypothetical protein
MAQRGWGTNPVAEPYAARPEGLPGGDSVVTRYIATPDSDWLSEEASDEHR